MNIAGLWDQLVLAVCRPPRDLYNGEDDLVGGRRAAFRLGQDRFYRQDVQLVNQRGQKIQASHYRPCVVTSADGRLPCVIYCHCNSGSRRDAEEILFHLLPKSITVFALDFTGSGQSEGSYVTLGAHEVEDLAVAVQYLREEGSTSTIGLWGRSMGAVTSLLYSQRDPSIAGMVLDSPFSRLSDLMMELATDQQLRIPKPLIKVALAMMRRSVRKRAGFSIDDVAPLDHASESYIPALFGHARDDTFVNKHHSERLFVAHSGDKNFITFDGDHNSVRPPFFYDSALIFLLHALRVEELVGPGVDLTPSAEDAGLLPHMINRDNSIYIASQSSGASSRVTTATPTPTAAAVGAGAAAEEEEEEAGHAPASPSLQRQMSPPWDRARMPGHSQRGSHDSEFATAVAEASAALAAERQQQQQQGGGDVSSGAGMGALAAGPPAQAGQRGASRSRTSQGAGGGGLGEFAASLDEEAALQHALELSLRDMQQQQPGSDAASAEHRRYNHLYSTSGPQDPLYGRSTDAEAPLTRVDEEAMLAQAIAESLRVQGGEQQAERGAAAAVAPQPTQPQPALLPADLRARLEQPAQVPAQPSSPVPASTPGHGGAGPPAGLTHSPRMLHGSQGPATQHAQQEAAAVRAASAELQHALSSVAAAGGAGSSPAAGPSVAAPATEVSKPVLRGPARDLGA